MSSWGVQVTGLTALSQRWTYASQRLGTTVGAIVQRQLAAAVVYARANYLTGGTTSTRLASRTGALAAAFQQRVQVQNQSGGTVVTAQIGYLDGPRWAMVHEGLDGRSQTTIRPQRGQYLALPLNDTARSMPPRSMPNTFVQTSHGGSLLIFQKQPDGSIRPMYLLKTEVVILARPALAPTMSHFTPLITEELRSAVRQMFTGSS